MRLRHVEGCRKFSKFKVASFKSISPFYFPKVIQPACCYVRIQAARKSARCWVSGSPVRPFFVHVPHIEAVVHDLAPLYCTNMWQRLEAIRRHIHPICVSA
jgi:hypothetical protein